MSNVSCCVLASHDLARQLSGYFDRPQHMPCETRRLEDFDFELVLTRNFVVVGGPSVAELWSKTNRFREFGIRCCRTAGWCFPRFGACFRGSFGTIEVLELVG